MGVASVIVERFPQDYFLARDSLFDGTQGRESAEQ